MAACIILLRTCLRKTIKLVRDGGFNVDVDLIFALIVKESDVCLVLGEQTVS